MNSKILEVSNNSLLQAKRYTIEGNYGRAFAHYLVYLELCKIDRNKVEEEFIDILIKWLDVLTLHQRNDDILNCLQSAFEYFPRNCTILTTTARYLMQWNQHKTAMNYLTIVLEENANYLPAMKLRNYIINVIFERWHIRMLNDKNRNESYRKAIEQKISEGYNNILDIGTGTGLLSLYANKSKYPVGRITACDTSNIMIELSKEIMDANDCSVVNLIEQRSTNMIVTEKFNLIVTEIFDSGVLGEGALDTLIHAWDHLLESNGKIIPANVEIHISGVQCNELARKHSVFTSEINDLNFESLKIINGDNDPYETEDLFCFKDCKYIANLTSPYVVNFNDVTQLKTLLNGEQIPLNLECNENGVIHAFILWFKLNLDDNISIDNRPCIENRNCCWEQAIFHLNQYLPVNFKEIICISLAYKDNILRIIQNLNKIETFRVPTSVVRFLNDVQILETISKTAYIICEKSVTSLRVLDLNPFPFLGLLLMKNRGGVLKCYALDNTVQDLIKKVCEINDIQCELTFIENVVNCDNIYEKFDVIYVNVLETEGELNQNTLLQLPLLQHLIKPNGMLLPSNISVYGSVVECDWFKRVSHVDDANVSDFRVSEFVKKYESNEQLDFTLRHLNYKNLTEPSVLTCINLSKYKNDTIGKDLSINVQNNGKANAICYWFELNLLDYKYTTGFENPNAYVNNAAFLLNPELSMNENDKITLQIIEHSGLLKILIH